MTGNNTGNGIKNNFFFVKSKICLTFGVIFFEFVEYFKMDWTKITHKQAFKVYKKEDINGPIRRLNHKGRDPDEDFQIACEIVEYTYDHFKFRLHRNSDLTLTDISSVCKFKLTLLLFIWKKL